MTGVGVAAPVDPAALFVVTRPQPEADALCDALRARGRDALAYPVLAIEPATDAAALATAMSRVDDYRLVVFVSPNAIRRALAARVAPWPSTTTIGVMGPGSRASLAAAGVGDDVRVVSPAERAPDADVDDRFDSESLFAALDDALGLARGFDGRVLIVRGNGGRAWFADRLRSVGVAVDEVEAYRRVRPAPDDAASSTLRRRFDERRPVAFVVTSSEGLSNLATMIEESLAPVADADAARALAACRDDRRAASTHRRAGARGRLHGDPPVRERRSRHPRHDRMTRVSSIPSPPHPAVLAPAAPVTLDAVPSAMRDEVRRLRRTVLLWIVAALVVLVVLAVGLWFIAANRLDRSEREFARRIQDDGVASRSAQTLAQQVQDQSLANAAKLGALEARVADSQSQQASLEQLYTDLARTRDDWALAEVEQILAVASQQLQLAGNVQGAIIALQNADQRLARTDRPQFIVLRRAIAKDLEKLKALPSVDVAGSALRIDTIVGMIDSLPLLSNERPAPADVGAAPSKQAPPDAQAGWFDRMTSHVRQLADDAWSRFAQLVRVRDVRVPDALLLTPSQAYFVRENVKLRLLNARLALLGRQEATYRSDLAHAHEAILKYFDPASRQTQAALALLKQVENANTVVEMPTLADSLAAARNVKGQR